MLRLLHYCADHARWLLVAGLIAPVLLPGLALQLQSWIAEFVAGLLFLAALRIGPRAFVGTRRDIAAGAATVIVYQLAMPLVFLGVCYALGWETSWTAIIVALVLAAPAVSASPNLLMIMGFRPDAALRMVCLGAAALPLTSVPIFALMPALGSPGEVAVASLRLLAVIGGAGGVAFAIRHWLVPAPSAAAMKAIDGLSAIGLAVIVVGLMAAVTPTFVNAPGDLAYWLSVAFAVNFGLQTVAYGAFRRFAPGLEPEPYALMAGNRNVALFLVALGENFSGEFLIFLGCYQFPMYLTPILMRRLYRGPARQ